MSIGTFYFGIGFLSGLLLAVLLNKIVYAIIVKRERRQLRKESEE